MAIKDPRRVADDRLTERMQKDATAALESVLGA